jgi:hypothetical protein
MKLTVEYGKFLSIPGSGNLKRQASKSVNHRQHGWITESLKPRICESEKRARPPTVRLPAANGLSSTTSTGLRHEPRQDSPNSELVSSTAAADAAAAAVESDGSAFLL